MHDNVYFHKTKEVTKDNITEAVQQAIEIEIATIPTYLYTYYSIVRSPNQNAISGALVQELMKKGMPLHEANKHALELSAEIMVFANKAGALIMSVAIEEMLHMALSSNLMQALGGTPRLVGKSPSEWPACLPGHNPPFEINKAKLTQQQLITFLLIESPDPILLRSAPHEPFPYRTIGEFYQMIEDCICHSDIVYNLEAPQLIPGKGYYAPNTIDTVYYDKKHCPRFVNSEDSGDLVRVVDRESACKAIHTIVEQGEGQKHAPGLLPGRRVDCAVVPVDHDDASDTELSHFVKFSQIYCRYERLEHRFKTMGLEHINISNYFVLNFPDNPVTANYPASIQPVSTLINAVYTYIFVMTEGCYRAEGNTQYEIFMFGIHKSMIFILNSLCGDISNVSYTSGGRTYRVAPTFEDYAFGLVSSPKAQLVALFATAVAAYPAIAYLAQRFQDLPDVALDKG